MRLLYANFGERHCPRCAAALSVLTEDEIVVRLLQLAEREQVTVFAPLVRQVRGSHRTLLALLTARFGAPAVYVDGRPQLAEEGEALNPAIPHDIAVLIARLEADQPAAAARAAVAAALATGIDAVMAQWSGGATMLSRSPVCVDCGTWFGDLKPVHFHTPCPVCNIRGCEQCAFTGLHPQAAATVWHGLRLPELLARTVDELRLVFATRAVPSAMHRLQDEITRRLDALQRVGLGYIGLDRPAPSLSRGEAQRLRLAVALTSRSEDMLHILDEPSVGQHPADVQRLVTAFRDLAGPGDLCRSRSHRRRGGRCGHRSVPPPETRVVRFIFRARPRSCGEADTAPRQYFSQRQRVRLTGAPRPDPAGYLIVRCANLRNLRDIDVPIPLGRLTVVTGVSGSGKSTLVEDVLVASLRGGAAVGCAGIDGSRVKPVFVDQSPSDTIHAPTRPRTPDSPTSPRLLCKAHRPVLRIFFVQSSRRRLPALRRHGRGGSQDALPPIHVIACEACGGRRFSDAVLARRIPIGERALSVADVYAATIAEVAPVLLDQANLPAHDRRAERILRSLIDIGLGHLALGQSSPTLSGGEAQRVKLASTWDGTRWKRTCFVLDEPSTGLHPKDLAGLLEVLDRLVRRWCNRGRRGARHRRHPGGGLGGRSRSRRRITGWRSGVCGATRTPLSAAARSLPRGHWQPKKNSFHDRSTGNQTWPIRRSSASAMPARHNLKHVDVDIPKGALTVVTGSRCVSPVVTASRDLSGRATIRSKLQFRTSHCNPEFLVVN